MVLASTALGVPQALAVPPVLSRQSSLASGFGAGVQRTSAPPNQLPLGQQDGLEG